MKVIIAGGREFNNYELLKAKLDPLLGSISEVISGTANGADILGEKWAYNNFIPVKRFPADWEKYGKAAGHKRNLQMAEYADTLVAFWDTKSKGTENMIQTAEKLGLNINIIYYNMSQEQW